ncbi:MAG: DNA mismatch repair endonuclease MutL [Polyangiaceae bacterium]|nr:DNA mismatch repair endonuclease MutL [Polyangiaceae bacterium]
MGCIHKLSGDLANQIAAGEVVERPASIVKELVENALDANATRVVVDIEQGGRTLIRVTDDGDGMTPDDAVICFERHATSKITRFEDLAVLGTFGFRGEALASVASIARVRLRTRARGASEGVAVVAEGGPPACAVPAGGGVGTSIEVRDLFFNVPARRKFLKATATESAHVGDAVLGAALARPEVTFVLSRDGRPVREYLRVATRIERARAALVGEKLAECTFEQGPIRGQAMLAPPECARAGTTGLSLLVNGRHVRDRQLARAVAQAYGSVLESGRYPVGVVWIDVPPDVVDVNVHPQKAEVRFADARGIFDAVTHNLASALARSFGLPEQDAPQVPWAQRSVAIPTYNSFSNTDWSPSTSPPAPREPDAVMLADSADSAFVPSPLPAENLFLSPTSPLPPLASDSSNHAFAGAGAGGSLYASLRFVGQIKATYLVCEAADGICVLDQHAAAERVTFDRLRRAHASRRVAMQRLLVPSVVNLAPSEVALLEEQAGEVLHFGVDVRAVGDGAVAVHGVPDLLVHVEPARIIHDLISELSHAAGRSLRGEVDLVLATMACHGSVRAGDVVTREQAEALLAALDDVDFGGHCPHGRPVVMRLPFGELERRVGR